MGRVTARAPVVRIAADRAVDRQDTVVVEEPLEIRINGAPLSVTMRTPGDDIDLVHGFLVSEGVIASAADVVLARYCAGADESGANSYNVLDVTLSPDVPDVLARRTFVTSSACGICGVASIEQVRTVSRHDLHSDTCTVDASVIAALPDALRRSQRIFDRTGGVHAAGLFAATGDIIAVREDVGRHNAVDKIVGDAVRRDAMPLRQHVLMVSGRVSFELTQKAVMAGIPVLAAVSAPSSLAIELAAESGMTLIAFVRPGSMNVYTEPQRVIAHP